MQNPYKPKNRTVLYLVLLVAVAGLMLLMRNCRDLSVPGGTGQRGDTLRVAIQYAPGSFQMMGDTLGGVDYDALRAIGLPFRLYPISDPAEGLAGLNDGRYDIVVADLPMTADSMTDYIFTSPVYLDRQVLVQRRDSTLTSSVNSVLDLGGKRICVVEGSPMASRLHNLEREIGAPITVDERPVTAERLLMLLAHGADSVDYVVTNRLTAEELARDYPGLDFSTDVSLTQFQPWVVAKGREALRDTLNARLKALGRDINRPTTRPGLSDSVQTRP